MEKLDKRKKIVNFVVFIIVLGFMIGATIYWFTYQNELGRRGDLVGDGVCGNLPDDESQDACCAEAHRQDSVEACEGRWQYVSGIKFCQYVCAGQLVVCPEDAKVCSDGRIVERNAGEDCEFDEC